MRLYDFGAHLNASGKRLKQIRRHLGVGIDNNDGVGKTVRLARFEGKFQRLTFTAVCGVVALQHFGAGGARDLRSRIAAIIGDHEYTETIRGPIEL